MQTSKENTANVDDAINGKSMNYLLKDHLGSYNVIADENGSKLEELSFDACSVKLAFYESCEIKSKVVN